MLRVYVGAGESSNIEKDLDALVKVEGEAGIMLVEMKHISKQLGSFRLDDISLELPEGYILGLIGPNGSGKTTLLHVLLGLYEQSEGTVAIDGMKYADAEPAIRDETGVVLLEDMFDGGLSLLANGDSYGSFFGGYKREKLLGYLERFGLSPKRKFRTLSRGEKLKFQFAFALSHDAKLLVLDEPTGNFDRKFRKDFFQVLKEFIADGKRSVILSTHLTEDLDRIADYILYLEHGKSIFSGDIETLRESYRLVIGEKWQIRAVDKELVVHVEEGEHGTWALLRNIYGIGRFLKSEGSGLTVRVPTLEELMYFMTKR